MKKIICRMCQKEFPKNAIINGKRRCLNNRKFCLDCSPFGLFNRRSDIPKVDKIPRDKMQYSMLPEKRKNQLRMAVKKSGAKRKTELVNIFGGKCQKCSYCKCERALTFHHRIPSEKEFELTIPNLSSHSWNKVLEEAKKCDMYCMNCHAEVENEISLSDPKCYRHYI